MFWLVGWVVLATKLVLYLTVPLGVEVENAQRVLQSREEKMRAGLMWERIPTLAESVWSSVAGRGEVQIRIYGWVLLTLACLGIARLAKVWNRDENPLLPGLVFLICAANPWLTGASLTTLPGMWVILGMVGFWGFESSLIKLVGAGIMILSGWAGIGVGAAAIITSGSQKRWLVAIPAVMVLIANATGNWSYIKSSFGGSLLERLQPKKIEDQIGEIQKINFLATQKTHIQPEMWRKLIYNKPVMMVRGVSEKAVGLLDFTLWTAPLSGWVITSMSGISPKDSLPLLFFWEIPLIVLGLLSLGKHKWGLLLLTAGVVPLIFETKFFPRLGIGFLPIAIYLAARGGMKLMQKQVKIIGGVVCLVYVVGSVYFLNNVFFQQESWRRADKVLYARAAKWIQQEGAGKSLVVVTDRFGPMPLMLAYYLPTLARVEVRAFELEGEKLLPNSAYIGLPGEFVGMGKEFVFPKKDGVKFLAINYGDELVHKFGAGLWIMQNDK